ncbi:hypothetical protein M9H77_04191 [Catharanthus roseus]|uniref:Uncharacterized protein n=1 Tax=Catharanthus roseus TaxID=4058 RepID=A0ACC0CDY3_CATRO|nr:hypothetical protein M9H77_04191 [Catharanthus roseus]
MEKELGPILEDSSISISLNPSSLCYEVSIEELISLLDSYNFKLSLIGDMCIISFEGNIFLLVLSMTNWLSSHFSLEDLLMSSGVVLDLSCHSFGNLDDTSLVALNIVGFVFEFDRKSLQHVCTTKLTRERRHTKEFKGQGESVGGKLIICYGDLIRLVLDLDQMLKYSSSCAFLEKQLMEFMWLLNFRKKMNGSLKVFKAHLFDLVKTTFGNGVFELNLKNLLEKHLVYSTAFVDFLFKDEALNETIVQNTKSSVEIENQSLGATSLYSLTFKEFLDELIFKRELKLLQVLMSNQKCPLLNNVLKLFWKKSRIDSRMNLFKGGADGITWKPQGTVELL